MRRSIKVSAPNAGRRVDAYLRLELANTPRHLIMKWLRTGVIRVNGKKAKPEARLVEGDEIGLPVLEHEGDRGGPRAEGRKPIADGRSPMAVSRLPRANGRKPKLDIVFEDDDLLIVNKPPHLPAHAGTGHTDTLDSRVLAYLDADNAPVGHKPGLAQRLDSGVSGLVPIGKHAGSLRVLAKAVANDELRKIYQGIVTGELADATGEIRTPLRIDDQPKPNKPRAFPDPNGLPAHTTWTCVELLRGATLVDVEIHTGRTHQIRAHLRSIRHPLVGDPRYGDAAADTKLGSRLDRPALHARRLVMKHPTTGETITVDAPLPTDMTALLAALRRH